jgi:hypothetical protein
MAAVKGPADFRSAKTGQFVTERFAKTHPATTEKEHNKPPPAAKPTGKGK